MWLELPNDPDDEELPASGAASATAPKSETAAARDVTSGRTLGNYELLEELGRGGMGVVWRARQKNLGRSVALKVLPGALGASADLRQRFRSEAAIAADLRHPGIVALHEFGEHEGQLWYSMELVPGKTLAEVAQRNPMSARVAAELLEKLCTAVGYAHQRGVLHRDLKPSNVLFDEFGEPRIADFGLAKRMDPVVASAPGAPSAGATPADLTASAGILGSPSFMPPEQISSRHGRLGPASDVYALGGILYYCLCGRAPFVGHSTEEVLLQVIDSTPASLRASGATIPADLETICLKCLEKDPSKRFVSAEALRTELRRFLDGLPILSRPVNVLTRFGRWVRRRPAVAAAVGLAAFAIVGGLLQHRSATRRIARAEQDRQAQAEQALEQRYAADMAAAALAADSGDRSKVRSLLAAYHPRDQQPDLRGFEWHLLATGTKEPRERVALIPTNGMAGATFSPNGRRLGVVRSNRVEIVDPLSGQVVGTILSDRAQPQVTMFGVAFSTDGRTAAARFTDAVRIWREGESAQATVPVGSIEALGPAGAAQALFLSPDSRRLVCGWFGRLPTMIRKTDVWDCSNGQWLRTVEAVGIPQWISPTDFAVAGVDGRLSRWEAETGRGIIVDISSPVSAPAGWSADGRWVAWVSLTDNRVRVNDTWTGIVVGRASPRAMPARIVFSGDKRWMFGLGIRGNVSRWNTSTWEEQALIDGTGPLFDLLAETDGRRFWTVGADGWVLRWEAEASKGFRPRILTNTVQVGRGYHPIAFSPDGRWAAWMPAHAETTLWDRQRRTVHTNFAGLLAGFSPSGDAIRLLESGAIAVEVNLRTSQRRVWGALPAGLELQVATVSPAGDRCIGLEYSTSPRPTVVSLTDSRIIHQARGDAVVTVADDASAAAVYDGAHVEIWDGAGKLLLDRPARAASAAAFSRDGQRVVAAHDSVLEIFQLPGGKSLGVVASQLTSVEDLAWSPNGRTIALCDGSDRLLLWSVPAQRELGSIATPGSARFVKFAPDGKELIAGGNGWYLVLEVDEDSKVPAGQSDPLSTAPRIDLQTLVPVRPPGIPTPTEAEALCVSNLLEIRSGVEAYRRAHGLQFPTALADLFPEFLSNTNCLTCPVHAWHSQTIASIPLFASLGLLDSRLPTSYSWELAERPALVPSSVPGWELGLSVAQTKQLECEHFGDIVPLLRCALHGAFLNLPIHGKPYLSSADWSLAALAQNASAERSTHTVDFPQASVVIRPTNGFSWVESVCATNLLRVYQGLTAYRAANQGRLPNSIADLFPRFLTDTNHLVCPVHRATGADSLPFEALRDPRVKCSYSWEMQPRIVDWPEGSPDYRSGMTMAQFKEAQRTRFGDIVPVAICYGHTRRLNLSLAGEVYPSLGPWEFVAQARLAHTNPPVFTFGAAGCSSNLQTLFRATQRYRQDHAGKMPHQLSDLFPQSVSDTNVLICPNHRRGGQVHISPSILTAFGLTDPVLPCSYNWTQSPKTITWTDDSTDFVPGMTIRGLTEREVGRWGGAVPLMRCYMHSPYVTLTHDGEIVRDSSGWHVDAALRRAELLRQQRGAFVPAALPPLPGDRVGGREIPR